MFGYSIPAQDRTFSQSAATSPTHFSVLFNAFGAVCAAVWGFSAGFSAFWAGLLTGFAFVAYFGRA